MNKLWIILITFLGVFTLVQGSYAADSSMSSDTNFNFQNKFIFENGTFYLDKQVVSDGKIICNIINKPPYLASNQQEIIKKGFGAVRFNDQTFNAGDSGLVNLKIFGGRDMSLPQFICINIGGSNKADDIPIVMYQIDPSRSIYQSISYIRFNPDISNDFVWGPELKFHPSGEIKGNFYNGGDNFVSENWSNREITITNRPDHFGGGEEGWGSVNNYAPLQYPSGQIRPTCSTFHGDTDGDYICNDWESGVLDITVNGLNYHESCPASLNACPSTTVKDVYLEFDAWSGSTPENRNYAPQWNELNALIDSFSCGPAPLRACSVYENVKLHIFGPPGSGTTSNSVMNTITIPDELATVRGNLFASELTDQAHKDLKGLVYHWMFLTGYIDGDPSSSGTGEIYGNDSVVTLGDPAFQATIADARMGTMMHELGHNLNLYHGGSSSNDINCKPNYLSVMNYNFQMSYFTTRPLDYSQSALGTLKETQLVDSAGVSSSTPAGLTTVFGPLNLGDRSVTIGITPYWYRTHLADGTNIDWNNDASATGTSGKPSNVDINYMGFPGCMSTPSSPQITGFKDWSNLKYDFRTTTNYAPGAEFLPDQSEEVNGKVVTEIRKHGIDNVKLYLKSLPDAVYGPHLGNKTSLLQQFNTTEDLVSNYDLMGVINSLKQIKQNVNSFVVDGTEKSKVGLELDRLSTLFKVSSKYTNISISSDELDKDGITHVTVVDPDAQNSVTIHVISSTQTSPLDLQVPETAPDTGIFEIDLETASAQQNNKLFVHSGDIVKIYMDNADFAYFVNVKYIK